MVVAGLLLTHIAQEDSFEGMGLGIKLSRTSSRLPEAPRVHKGKCHKFTVRNITHARRLGLSLLATVELQYVHVNY